LYSKISTDKGLGQCLRSDQYSGGKLSPVEFICVGLLIGVCGVGIGGGGGGKNGKARLGLEGLSREIERMRDVVREEHVDIRMNDRVAKTMLEFIRGVGGESGRVGAGAGVKRKRGVAADKERDREEDVEEGEVMNGKLAKTGNGKKTATAASSPVKSTTVAAPAERPTPRLKETARKSAGGTAPRAPLGDKLASVRAAKLQTQQNAQKASLSRIETLSSTTMTTTPTSASASLRVFGMAPSPVSQQPLRLPTQTQPQPQPHEAQTHEMYNGNRARLEHPPGSNPGLVAYQHHPPYSPIQSHGSGRRDSWVSPSQRESGGDAGRGGGRRGTATNANAVPIRGGGASGWGSRGESGSNSRAWGGNEGSGSNSGWGH